MLLDYLVDDWEPLEVDETDRKAVYHAQEGRPLQVVAKFCIANMLKARNDLFNSEQVLSEAQVEGLAQAHRAYRAVAQFILEPIEDALGEELTNE